MTDTHWPDYYAVTVDRPAWGTVIGAADLFEADDAARFKSGDAARFGAPGDGSRIEADDRARGRAPDDASRFEADDAARGGAPGDRLAVDLGCGAGRDTRELLRRGWRVLAVDGEASAITALLDATPAPDIERLETAVADIGAFELPPCDLVVASVSLQFLDAAAYATVFERMAAALPAGGRFAGYLYGDKDEAAADPAYTCPSADRIRELLAGFEIELWSEREEDGHMALGDPHHLHLIEVIARRR